MGTDAHVVLLTGAEGGDIPAGVPMQELTPEAPEAAGGAPEPVGEVVEKSAGEEAATTSPGIALEVAIRSPEIQDAEPIRSAPMTEATSGSRGGIELLADDLVEPATVAKHMEAVRQAEQWMKVRDRSLRVVNPLLLSTLRDLSCLVQDVAERSREKSNLLQGYGDTVLRAEALEEQLVKSRKHAAAMQSKLDAAFAKYHNDVMELQAKGDELVRKNKGLRNKNKGMSFDLSGTCWKS
jgi:hypothetical protein